MGWFNKKPDLVHKKHVDAVLSLTSTLFDTLAKVELDLAYARSLPDSLFRCMLFSLVTVYITVYGRLKKPESVLGDCCVCVTLHCLKTPEAFFGGLITQQESVSRGGKYSSFFLNHWGNHITAGRFDTPAGRAVVATMLRYVVSEATPDSVEMTKLLTIATNLKEVTGSIDASFARLTL